MTKTSPVRTITIWKKRTPTRWERLPATVGGEPLGEPQPIVLDGELVGHVRCTRSIGRRSYEARGVGAKPIYGYGDSATEAARSLCGKTGAYRALGADAAA